MKSNQRTVIVALCLVLASVLALTGCMYALAAETGDEKPYTSEDFENSFGDAVIEDAPVSQDSMQKKHGAYLHISEDGNSVTIFSAEQLDELLSVRASGKRNAVTYDDILYIINDSVRIYFAYDTVVLNADLSKQLDLNVFTCNDTGVITTCEPDSDINYSKMVRDIYSIIVYRLYALDSGFTHMYYGVLSYPETLEFEHMYSYEGDGICDQENFFETKNWFVLSLDGGTEIGTEYNQKLCADHAAIASEHMAMSNPDPDFVFDFEGNSISAPYFIIEAPIVEDSYNYRYVASYKMYHIGEDASTYTTLYPTAEINSFKREGYFDRVFNFPVESVTIHAGDYSQYQVCSELSEEDKAALIAILNCDTPWESGLSLDPVICRFNLDGAGFNYRDGIIYSTSCTYLPLTEEQNEIVASIVEKYDNYFEIYHGEIKEIEFYPFNPFVQDELVWATEITEEEFNRISEILNRDEPWQKRDYDSHEITARLDINGRGFNYSVDRIYDTAGGMLILTEEECAFFDALIEKYNND